MEDPLLDKDTNQSLSLSKTVKQFLQNKSLIWLSTGLVSVYGGLFCYYLTETCKNGLNKGAFSPEHTVPWLMILILGLAKRLRVVTAKLKVPTFLLVVTGLVLAVVPQFLFEKTLPGLGMWMMWLFYVFSVTHILQLKTKYFVVHTVVIVLVQNYFLPRDDYLKWVFLALVYGFLIGFLTDWLSDEYDEVPVIQESPQTVCKKVCIK